MYLLLILSLILFPLAPLSCRRNEAKPKPAVLPVVMTRVVQSEKIFDQFHYPARVTSKISTTLLADSEGIVTELSSQLGQRVKKTQTVLKITQNDPVYQYAPLSVSAPVTGAISKIYINVGSHVSKGQKLLTLTDPNQVHLVLEVPEQELSYLELGMTGYFKIPGRSGAVKASITGLSPTIHPSTGTASVELRPIPPYYIPLNPGVIGQVVFELNNHPGVLIPDTAIMFKGDETLVRTIETGKIKLVRVKLGRKQNGFTEVLEGLSPNETLVERSSRFLADGESVQIENKTKADTETHL